MANPALFSPLDCSAYFFLFGFLPELFICYFVRPPYLKDVSEATVDEDLEFVVERLSSFPRFTAIEKNWFNVGVENADLSVYG